MRWAPRGGAGDFARFAARLTTGYGREVAKSDLVQRLGLAGGSRVVIVRVSGLGTTHAANVGVYESLREGVATTASLHVPCPWARHASANYRGEDLGVSLTLNAEHALYRWGPITHAPSLLDGNGGFPMTVDDLWDHADLDEARRECRAQIERAIYWGFDVTHLDGHLDALALRPEFFDLLLDLALEFNLPLRLPSQAAEDRAGFPFRALAAQEGVVFPDYVIDLSPTSPFGWVPAADITSFEPGVTEIRLTPAVDTPELRALHERWPHQVDHLRMLENGATLSKLFAAQGVVTIGYRELRQLMRH